MRRRLAIAALMATTVVSSAYAQQQTAKLSAMSLEDLLNIEVTSVSKTEQKLSQTASAIYVITQEDIQRSGATNIPDLLRMVPGMDVGQINASSWAISARGLNELYSHELLVMVDGRTVYTPTSGGVYWDVVDVPLEDIERIEVIRGPGGSVWGANAVNGVVNIITKTAAETRGAMVVAGGGNLDQGFGTLQYGGSAGQSTNYRVYSKYFNQGQLPSATEANGADGWRFLRGGFRSDTNLSTKNSLSFQGDLYLGREGLFAKSLPSVTMPSLVQSPEAGNLTGGSLQMVWKHTYSARSDTTLQISYDQYRRDHILAERRGTIGIDFAHHLLWGERQNVVWGVGYRYSASESDGSLSYFLVPANLNIQLFSSFVEDEIAVVRNRLYVTPGAKVEHNYYSGFGIMPSIRAVWLPSAHQTVWAAASRALRTPAENDAAGRVTFGGFTAADGMPVLVGIVGNPKLADESFATYELGYRTRLSDRLSVDLAAYYTEGDHQETSEPVAPFFEALPAPAHLVLAQENENLMYGEAHGLEVFATWKVSRRLTLSPGYAFERIHEHLDPSSQDTTSVAAAEGSSPVNSAQLRLHLSLPRGLAWDTYAYFVGRISDPVVPSYTRLDTGLTWQAGERLSFSIFGQNLLKNERLEYVDASQSTAFTLMKRSAYAKIRWVL
ncbi:MAG: TonB-dependent receptor [Acidobacteria bacterium]|nr:MAG: TonB-dependent receptor [Acidobacteriota bacterium]